MKTFFTLFTLCALVSQTAFAQDHHDWQQSLAHLHLGDRLHLTLKTGPVDAAFAGFTPQDLTLDAGTFKKEDVLRIESLQAKGGGGSRVKRALIGAAIGAGGGAAIGAASCPSHDFCTRGEFAGIFAGIGLVVGLAVGAILPTGHGKHHTIYSAA